MWGKGTSRLGSDSLSPALTDTLSSPVTPSWHTHTLLTTRSHTRKLIDFVNRADAADIQAEWQGLGEGHVNISFHMFVCYSARPSWIFQDWPTEHGLFFLALNLSFWFRSTRTLSPQGFPVESWHALGGYWAVPLQQPGFRDLFKWSTDGIQFII